MMNPDTMGAAWILPYLYVVLAEIVVFSYLRRRYMKPAPEVCRNCRLYGFCNRLGLNRLAPPAKFVKRVPTRVKAVIIITLLAGYAASIALALSLGTLNPVPYVIVGAAILPAMLEWIKFP